MINTKKFLRSFRHAFNGIKHAFTEDQNLRIHFIIAIIVIDASIFFRVTPFEMGILGLMILLVMSTEMINSAIESMVDLITKEHREEAKTAKDVAAGMVLLTSIGSAIVGVLIFMPYISKMIWGD